MPNATEAVPILLFLNLIIISAIASRVWDIWEFFKDTKIHEFIEDPKINLDEITGQLGEVTEELRSINEGIERLDSRLRAIEQSNERLQDLKDELRSINNGIGDLNDRLRDIEEAVVNLKE